VNVEVATRRCCGIDVHKKSVMVHVLPPEGERNGKPQEREFRTFSRDLRSLRNWLTRLHVTEVVMESTGQYWRPLWNILEGEIPRLVLVNPAHVKALAGRKTDRIDSQRLARYLESQDLDGSFVPPREVRELRDLTRSRVHLLQEVNRVKNRITQLCEAGNIKVSSVASDLFGVSGRKMLAAVAEGRRDPGWMADYACGTLRNKKKELEFALEGSFTNHQRWLLREELGHLSTLEAQIGRVEQEIERQMKPYAEHLRRLDTIPGIDVITAWTLVAELGPDMSVFPDANQCASWAGLCPGNKKSAGKRLSGRTRKANPYLRRDLCQAAWAASHTKGTYLSALYRRYRMQLGHHKAIVAVAHQMLITAHTMLSRGEDYRELGEDYFDQKNKPQVTKRLVKRLANLGYTVTLTESAPPPAAVPAPEQTIAADTLASSPDPAQSAPQAPAASAPQAPVASPEPAPPPAPRRRGRPCKCAERGIVCLHKKSLDEAHPNNLSA
jgi:transposase